MKKRLNYNISSPNNSPYKRVRFRRRTCRTTLNRKNDKTSNTARPARCYN